VDNKKMTFRLTDKGEKHTKKALKKFTKKEQEHIKKIAEEIQSILEKKYTSKRIKVKGHYRVIVRDERGRIVSSKKWSSKQGEKIENEFQ
jgi:hypothetical protein